MVMLPPIERRHSDPDAALPLAIIRGIIAVLLLLVVGSMLLEWHGIKAPEWVGNATLSLGSGLIGFLSRTPRIPHTTSGGPTLSGDVGTVNVEAAPEPEPPEGNP